MRPQAGCSTRGDALHSVIVQSGWRLCFSALERSGIEPKRLQLVQHSLTHPPKIVLVEGVRMGRPGLKVLPTLFVNEFNAQWRKEITHETAL